MTCFYLFSVKQVQNDTQLVIIIAFFMENYFASNLLAKSFPKPPILGNDASEGSDNRKQQIVIDLLDTEESGSTLIPTPTHQKSEIDRKAQHQNQPLENPIVSEVKLKETMETKNDRRKFVQQKMKKKHIRNDNPRVLRQIYDVDSSTSHLIFRNNQKPNMLQQLENQPCTPQKFDKNEPKKFKKQKNQNINKNLYQSVVVEKSTYFRQSAVNCSADSDTTYPKRAAPTVSSNEFQPMARRKTRSKTRIVGSLYEGPDNIDFFDEEVRTRFNVAKYRYGIDEIKNKITEMAAQLGNKTNFGPSIARLPANPTIGMHTYKHKIFAKCLSVQLNKRKIIYLD